MLSDAVETIEVCDALYKKGLFVNCERDDDDLIDDA